MLATAPPTSTRPNKCRSRTLIVRGSSASRSAGGVAARAIALAGALPMVRPNARPLRREATLPALAALCCVALATLTDASCPTPRCRYSGRDGVDRHCRSHLGSDARFVQRHSRSHAPFARALWKPGSCSPSMPPQQHQSDDDPSLSDPAFLTARAGSPCRTCGRHPHRRSTLSGSDRIRDVGLARNHRFCRSVRLVAGQCWDRFGAPRIHV